MGVQTSEFINVWLQNKQIWAILTQLKLWAAAARHNFKRIKIKLYNLLLEWLTLQARSNKTQEVGLMLI